MAIYSFNHDSFGKTTNRAEAAGENVRYNADLSKTQTDAFLAANARYLEEHGTHRPETEIEAHLAQLRQGRSAADNAAYNARLDATYAVRSHVIPPEPGKAQAWFDKQEKADRKNARMSDRFIGALPRELTPEQCIEAVEKFCRDVTQDRVPWHFALHLELERKGEPDWNPHTHIIFRDRDIETGRRSLYTSAGPKERRELSEKGIDAWSTTRFREKWSRDLNHALFRAGHDERIDHRTLKEQGIDRDPQIHVGPGSHNAAKKGHEFQSRDRLRGERTIPYTVIDEVTRAEHNRQIVEGNNVRDEIKANAQMTQLQPRPEAHPAREQLPIPRMTPQDKEQKQLRNAQAETRRAMYKEQKRDRDALHQAQLAQREQHKTWTKELYANARKTAFEQVKEQASGKWKAIRAIQDRAERDKAVAALKLEQKALYAKTAASNVAAARPQKNEAWQAMRAGQIQERATLRTAHRDEYASLAKQQAAERRALTLEQHALQLQRETNRIAAGMAGRQNMPNQQRRAVQMIHAHQHARDNTKSAAVPVATPQNLAEAVKTFTKIAVSERDRRGQIRAGLNAQRQTNRLCASTPQRFRAQAGPPRSPAEAARRAQASPPDAQIQVRQAAQSGRTLTSDERASAPPELLRYRLEARDKAAQRARHGDGNTTRQHKRNGKGRTGGGRGR